MYKRVVIKISGEGLAGESKIDHFNDETIARIVNEINSLPKETEVAIVVGGGNIWRGRDAQTGMDKTKAHQMGMVSTIINGIYLSEAFRMASKRKAIVMTPYDVNGFTSIFTKEKALDCLSQSCVPIFAGGTGHPFFSTDSIVAIRACELQADAILYGKKIDSVYNKDPNKFSDAKRYKTVSYQTVIGNNLEVADISAVSLTSNENIPSLVFALEKKDSIIEACSGDENLFKIGGTKIHNNIENIFY